MTTTHTPGPWALDTRMSSEGFWTVLGRLEDGSLEYVVAHVIDANDRAQNDTNARLIAAAPELLEALKTARSKLQTWIDAVGPLSDVVEAIEQADAALAKVQP